MAVFLNSSNQHQIPVIIRESQTLPYVAPCVVGFIMVIGIVGNISTIIALLSNKDREKSQSCFFYRITQNVSACDLGLLSLVCPLFAVEFARERWIFGSAVCSVMRPLDFTAQVVSFYSICFAGVDTAFAVANPRTYQRKQKGGVACGSILILWALAMVLTLPLWVFSGLQSSPGGEICTIAWPSNSVISFEIYGLVFAIGVPVLMTVCCMIAILANLSGKLWRPTEADSAKRAKDMVNLMAALAASGLIFCGPSYIVPLVRDKSPEDGPLSEQDVQEFFTLTCFGYAFSCIKPMLYVFVYSDIRNMMADLIPSRSGNNIKSNGLKYKKSPHFSPTKNTRSPQRHYVDHRCPDSPISTHSFPGSRSRAESHICLQNMFTLQFAEDDWRRKTL